MGRRKGGTNTYHSTEEKLSLVKRNLEGETLTSLEKETRICVSQIYKWIKRKGIPNRYEVQHKELDYYVADIHSHYPSQGYRTIVDTLLNMYGWIVSDVSVWKSMKRLGIRGYVRKRRNPDVNGFEHNRFSNELRREFHAKKTYAKDCNGCYLHKA